jgi:uncharacterized membrane protein (GlpM family)
MDKISFSGIVLRFVLGGGAVAAAYVVSRYFSGRTGGIFAAFPAVYLAAVIGVGVSGVADKGLDRVLLVSRGALIGMAANVFCALAAAYLIPRTGWRKGLALALAAWFVMAVVIMLVAEYYGW